MENIAQQRADQVYHSFFERAKNERFDDKTAHYLALKPADYIYKTIITKGCIHPRCCVEYCLDLMDSEFNSLDDATFNELFVRIHKVQPTNQNIRNLYRQKRENFKRYFFYEPIRSLRSTDQLTSKLSSLSVRKALSDIDINKSFKRMKL